jgi:predicted MFS family arabinose efflux permease
VYHGALAVTAIAGLVGNFAAGVWADRGSLRRLIAALLLMTGALVALLQVSMTASVIAQAVAMGVAGGSRRQGRLRPFYGLSDLRFSPVVSPRGLPPPQQRARR